MQPGEIKNLARNISLVENETPGYEQLLEALHPAEVPVIGITGPPGAGKSTLINALVSVLSAQNKKTAILAVDPTSPFNYGSLLGDRIRMAEHYNNPDIFIRSIATRGFLGGLSAKTIEITDVLKASGFDYIIIETVGVGQSEVEIAGLADCTVLVLVPEAGDEIQALKSGIMEIADLFVVNKSDREGAKEFISNLKKMLHQKSPGDRLIPVVGTVASRKEGISELLQAIDSFFKSKHTNHRKSLLLAEKAWQLLIRKRMHGLDKQRIAQQIADALSHGNFNLYKFIEQSSPEK